MDVHTFFPKLTPPSSASVLLDAAASTSASPERWTWTEHRPASGLCHFATHAWASKKNEREDDASAAWDGRLQDLDGGASVAIFASMPFGCVLHAARAHVLKFHPAHGSTSLRPAHGQGAKATIITSATKEALAANLSDGAEAGGNPMAWMATSTADPNSRHALEQIDIVHVTSLSELIAVLVHQRFADDGSTSGPGTLLICEGLSHLLAEADVRQLSAVLTLLHSLSPAGADPTETTLVLIDERLASLRLPPCLSVPPQPMDDEELSTDPRSAQKPPPPAPPQSHLHRVSVLPLLMRSFAWIGTQEDRPQVQSHGQPRPQPQPHHTLRLVFERGHRAGLRHALRTPAAESGPSQAATANDRMDGDGQRWCNSARARRLAPARQAEKYVLDVDVFWTD